MNYYNDSDPFCCEWLRSLITKGMIPDGHVDSRSIVDIGHSDLEGFTQCHFFAGIGGWPLALQIAGWPTDAPVWTGSCPCQPYSAAGKQKGQADERHLWPDMFRLVRECRPPVVFGEQVDRAVGHGWLDGVFADLEAEGYACGAIVLGAHSLGAPHIRQRLYWVADAGGTERGRRSQPERKHRGTLHIADRSGSCGLANSTGERRSGRAASATGPRGRDGIEDGGTAGGLVQPSVQGLEGLTRHGDDGYQPGRIDTPTPRSVATTSPTGAWSDYDLIHCRDGKTRRIEPGSFPLAHGVPNRVGRLRGYGNAIVPQVAAAFVRAFLEIE